MKPLFFATAKDGLIDGIYIWERTQAIP
jgi:hypothetical protein